MSIQPAVRILSRKVSTLPYLLCMLLAGASPILATSSTALHADPIRLTPKIDLHLEPTPVEGLPDRTLNLPPGFKVKLFSDQVDKARFMAWDDQGVLHVANMKPRRGNTWHPVSGRQSTVLALPDKDGDGRADTVYKAADDLNWPHSIAFYQGALFVADDDAIYRLKDQDADGFYEERTVFAEVPGFMGLAYEHVTHTLVFDESNDKLYFHIGAGCDICREDDPERSAVIQMNTDGSGSAHLCLWPTQCHRPRLAPGHWRTVGCQHWARPRGARPAAGVDHPPARRRLLWLAVCLRGQSLDRFLHSLLPKVNFSADRCRFTVGRQHGYSSRPHSRPLGTDGAAFLRRTTNSRPSTNTPRLSPAAPVPWAATPAIRSWCSLPSRMGPTPASPTSSPASGSTPTRMTTGGRSSVFSLLYRERVG